MFSAIFGLFIMPAFILLLAVILALKKGAAR